MMAVPVALLRLVVEPLRVVLLPLVALLRLVEPPRAVLLRLVVMPCWMVVVLRCPSSPNGPRECQTIAGRPSLRMITRVLMI